MLTAAMLGLIEKIGLDIMILTEEVDADEFFTSRMTRTQTLQLLSSLADRRRGRALLRFSSTLCLELQRVLPAPDDAALAVDFARDLHRIPEPRPERCVAAVLGCGFRRVERPAGGLSGRGAWKRGPGRSARRLR